MHDTILLLGIFIAIVIIMITTIVFALIAFRRKSLLPWLLVVGIIICDGLAQEEPAPSIDTLSILERHPIILDPPIMQSVSNSLLGWLGSEENEKWLAPEWLNATVNLTANVTA